MAFIVTFPTGNGPMPLRGTIIAMHMDRAQHFETHEAAEKALEKARQFMKAKTFKSATIREIK